MSCSRRIDRRPRLASSFLTQRAHAQVSGRDNDLPKASKHGNYQTNGSGQHSRLTSGPSAIVLFTETINRLHCARILDSVALPGFSATVLAATNPGEVAIVSPSLVQLP